MSDGKRPTGTPQPHDASLHENRYQAVILAAGRARRMRPLSDRCHKAMIPIGGTTILGRIVEGLLGAGVDRITVVTGHLATDVESFMRTNFPQAELHFVENTRFNDTNNIWSLSLALDHIEFDRDLVLVECDLLFDPSLIERLVRTPSPNVALLDRYRLGMDGTVVEVRDGYVTAVYPTAVQGADFSYVDKYKTLNIYKFDHQFCASVVHPLMNTYANRIDASSYYELVLGMLTNIPQHRIAAELVDPERWVEVDDPNDLVVAGYRFDPGSRAETLATRFGGYWNFDVTDFSLPTNVHFPTGAMIAAMRHALPELIANYGSTQHVLNEKMSYFVGCPPSRIQALHGAAQVMPMLADMYQGRRVAIPTPTFGEYRRLFPGAGMYDDRPGVDWADLEGASRSCGMVVVVTPNNPTGTTLATQDLHELAKDNPDTAFWVDESFAPFCDEVLLVDRLEAEPLDNVVVTTSLSKSLGSPGLRLGFLYSSDEALVRAIGERLPVWNLSSPAEFLLELLVKFVPDYKLALDRTKQDRREMQEALEMLPCISRVYPSGGNFLLVELASDDPKTAAAVRQGLLADKDLYVKDVTDRFPDAKARLRLAVRTPHENQLLIDGLAAEALRSR